MPGLFSVPPQATPGRWTAEQGTRATAAPGASCTIHPRPQPPQRAHRATQPGKGTGTQASPETGHRAAHSGAQAQAIHSPGDSTAGNAHKRPAEPPRAGVLSLYYPPPKRPTAAHRAAHRGQAAGVQKRRGGQAHSRHSPGTAPRAKIRAVFCDFLSDFLPFFSALSRSACEFYSRKVESRELIVESRSAMEVGAGLIVGKSVNRSVPRLHPPKVAWSGRRRCTSAGFHRLNSRCPVERSE